MKIYVKAVFGTVLTLLLYSFEKEQLTNEVKDAISQNKSISSVVTDQISFYEVDGDFQITGTTSTLKGNPPGATAIAQIEAINEEVQFYPAPNLI